MAAPQVTFRDGAGNRTQFFLSPDGRVDVATVLLCFGASVVMLEEADGSCSVLEKDPSTGLSRNVFNPGDVIAFRQAPGHAAPLAAPPPRLDAKRGCYTLDADTSIIMGGELLGEIDEELDVLVSNSTWTTVKTGKLEQGNDDPLYTLIGGRPDEMGIAEKGWDEPADGLDRFRCWFGNLPEGFRWLGQAERAGVQKVLAQVLVRNRNHEVLVDGSRGVSGALLGVGMYKRLTWTAVYRMHLDFFLWASVSELPYVQLMTDMKSGGVMFYCAGKSAVSRVVLRDISQVKDLIATLGGGLMDFTPSGTKFHRFKF